MRLLRAAEVPIAPLQVYRRGRLSAVVGWLLLVVGAAALALLAWSGRLEPFPGWWGAGALAFCAWLGRRALLARLGPHNWLVRRTGEGLYIQFRSHLNHHFPADTASVVFLAWSEIRSARLLRRRWQMPREWQQRRYWLMDRLIELELEGDTRALAEALAEERERPGPSVKRWYGRTSWRHLHRPARLRDERYLELEWHVWPSARRFLADVARHVDVAAPGWDRRDFTTPIDAELEARLRALVDTGRRVDAIALARRLRGLSLPQAKALVDGLAARDPA